MPEMTLKMTEIELMSAALGAGCSIYSLHNSQFVQQPCRWPPASLPLVTALYNLHKSHKFYDIEEFQNSGLCQLGLCLIAFDILNCPYGWVGE